MKRVTTLALLASSFVASHAQTVDPSLYSGLVWRNVGPFRAGRVASVTGVIGQPGVHYMGMPIGGVWKTTNAGVTWNPIKDDFEGAASVGAIEVAPSDPNVIYVGTGEITYGAQNSGTGAYKSTDAGKTWSKIGLAGTKQIPSILVDPRNPNIVMYAALGPINTKSKERGVFRSTDGGKTWTQPLFVDDMTGACKLASAYDEPDTIICSMKVHYSAGGGRGAFGSFGGADKLFKSTDGGATWKQMKGEGLPENMSGRQGLAIAMHTKAQRMFMVSGSGLFRSDDGGDTWRQMDKQDRRIANGQGGYNCGVYVNSANPDIVYVINTCSYISKDGGNTFTGFKGAPGGDDPQEFWFDPVDANHIFLGSDQGATISLDGGGTWSSWYNQPTAQVYHIAVDNRWPYWIYATQQDSGSIGTASRGNLGMITPFDWTTHPGYEFGSICADPLNPGITYAGSEGSGIIKCIQPTQQFVEVSPSINSTEGLRHVMNQPIMFSPVNPRELLAGFQYLMASTDGGLHWKKLSPDLCSPKEAPKPPATKPEVKPAAKPTQEAAIDDDDDDDGDDLPMQYHDKDYEYELMQRRGGGGSIDAFSVSVAAKGTIWTGSSNGFIQMTKDHGGTWTDVSDTSIPEAQRGDICGIEASHTNPAAAYCVVNRPDGKPYAYRTRDFGKTWQPIITGLPSDEPNGSFTRVIKEDPKRPGLLYLGTESRVFVSFDDGDHWQSLMNNLPVTSYRDMVVKDNDLVVGTYGRSFWILDDLTPLREITPAISAEPAHFFKPGDAIRVRRNVNRDTPFPPEVPHAVNAPVGAILYFNLKEAAKSPITLEISDAKGNVIRHMSSEAPPPSTDLQPIPDFWKAPPAVIPNHAGMCRFNWNLRYDNPPAFFTSYQINATPGETEPSPLGPIAMPGTYTLKLTVDGKVMTQKLTVNNDPRSAASASELAKQGQIIDSFYYGAITANNSATELNKLKDQLKELAHGTIPDDVAKAIDDLQTKLDNLAGKPATTGRGARAAFAGPATFSSLASTGTRNLQTLDNGDGSVTETIMNMNKGFQEALKGTLGRWEAIKKTDIPALNAMLAKGKLPPIKLN